MATGSETELLSCQRGTKPGCRELGVILSNSQISIQQQQGLRKANSKVPVPAPCPETFCVAEIPGFSQEHTLDFLMALAKGPSPCDALTNHPPTCLYPPNTAATMNKHYYLNTAQIRCCKDQNHTTENHCNKGTQSFHQK